jgi:hypothetical protein
LFGSFERKERKKKRGVTLMIKEKASKRERLITKKYAFGRVLKDSKNLSKKKKDSKKIQIHYFTLFGTIHYFSL